MKCQTNVRQVANETAIATGSTRVCVLKIERKQNKVQWLQAKSGKGERYKQTSGI
jgi:hypothetical protein